MTDAHSDRGHALLGGSSMEIALNCTGSVFHRMNYKFEEEENEAADLGTKTHEIGEALLTNLLIEKTDGTQNYMPIPACDDEETMTNAQGWRDIVWEKGLEQSITQKAWGVEALLTLDEKLQMWGYTDFWGAHIDDRGKRKGIIGDYKNGFIIKEAEGNPQLAFYACALRAELQRVGRDIDYVQAFIYQPRAIATNPYKETTFTAKQLDKWKEKFIKTAEQIFIKKKPKFKVGEHCRFCKAMTAGICEDFNKAQKRETNLDLVDVTTVTLPAPERLTIEQVSKIVLNADLLENFISGVKGFAIRELKAGRKVPGLKLVKGVAKRKWLDEARVASTLDKAGLTANEIYNFKLRGIGETEKLIKERLGLKNDDQVKGFFESITEKPDAPPVLSDEFDTREEYKTNTQLLDEKI